MITKPQRDFIKSEILKKLSELFLEGNAEKIKKYQKEDHSLVTEVDLFISGLLKKELSGMDNFNFYCEEDHDELSFPAIVLDPIDGTKGLAKGLAECSFSLAIMKDSKIDGGWGWIFNPFTGFEICSDDPFFPAINYQKNFLSCLVSRSEWEKGLYKKETSNSNIFVTPKGSIALKLGFLASGACEFVISKEPKSIWDIAAGTILCKQRGIKFYLGKVEQKSLDVKRLNSPLIWCREENLSHILSLLNFQ